MALISFTQSFKIGLQVCKSSKMENKLVHRENSVQCESLEKHSKKTAAVVGKESSKIFLFFFSDLPDFFVRL